MKVFLSRSTKDKQLVQTLADELKGSAGLVALYVAPTFAAVDFADLFAGSNELLARRGGVDFQNLLAR